MNENKKKNKKTSITLLGPENIKFPQHVFNNVGI